MSRDEKHCKIHASRHPHGVTLIEALVTLFVLSVGLVGIAALHLHSMQSAHSSYYRSLASVITLDFEERLWIAASTELIEPGQCLDDVNGEDIINRTLADLNQEWAVSAGMPDLVVSAFVQPDIDFTRLQPGASGQWRDRWKEMRVTILWTEGRFTNDQDPDDEEFNYLLRIPCVSEYTPGAP